MHIRGGKEKNLNLKFIAVSSPDWTLRRFGCEGNGAKKSAIKSNMTILAGDLIFATCCPRPGARATTAMHRPSSRRLGHRSRRLVGFASTPAYNASLSPVAGFSDAAAALHPCVLVRTYAGNRNGLVSLLWSLLLSGHPNLRAFVADTGSTPAPGLAGILRSVNALSGRDWVEMSRRTRAQDVRSRFPGLDGVEDYGYALTDLVMEDIMRAGAGDREEGPESNAPGDDPPAPSCDTLTVTNGDNVYGPDFLRQTLGRSPTWAWTWWARTGFRTMISDSVGARGRRRMRATGVDRTAAVERKR